ncbi:hypothetical protein ACBY01_04520 [Sphingomonas sp. ac-8]|uniref:hypothetical protein n=1 Tax=Sphingomonas sp. ac-8 TaxID=3242977 RepID=UPI003A80FAFF
MPSTSLATILATAVAAQSIALTRPARIRPEIDAYPRIAAPTVGPQQRINRALDRLDSRLRTAMRECMGAPGDNPTSWKRQIDAPMHGPEFVSYLITDEVDCGGAHPSTSHSAIVYDLRSGAPVDWTVLLPRHLTGELGLAERSGGVEVVTLTSARLFALYLAGYAHGANDTANDENCRDQVAGPDDAAPVPMFAWLDARQNGLVVQFDLNHANQACSEPVLIPAATLRHEGASARLLDALAAAHASVARQPSRNRAVGSDPRRVLRSK